MNDQTERDAETLAMEDTFLQEYGQLSAEQQKSVAKQITENVKQVRAAPVRKQGQDANAYLDGLSDTEFEAAQRRLANGRPTEAEAKLFAKGA